jgi:DNA cross-link repair 1A protein
MATVVRAEVAREPRTLFLVGSYSIGKERAVAAVARAAGRALHSFTNQLNLSRF